MTRRRLAHLASSAVVVATLLSSGLAVASLSPSQLPQTRARPLFTSLFQRDMAVLARAIAANNVVEAQRVFFLEKPYLSMKVGEIANPALDYRDRLVAFYQLDVRAYHHALYAHARTTYLYARANAALATWIVPGACENRIGYWHEPGVRLVFRRNGVVVSVAVDSLISWRGVWYVVHLGPNPRPRNVGTVDTWAKGPGTPGPAGGC